MRRGGIEGTLSSKLDQKFTGPLYVTKVPFDQETVSGSRGMSFRLKSTIIFYLKITTLWLIVFGGSANAQSCRQALILGLDVSLSVNLVDFRLQREGLALALLDTEVMDAMISASENQVELAVFEWSGQHNQDVLVNWTAIDSAQKLREISASLIHEPQMKRTGRTALGSAMQFAHDMLSTRRHCVNHTLDLSGDGRNNNGPPPEVIRRDLADAGVVVNGLVIEPNPDKASLDGAVEIQLSQYFQERVIVGHSSFVETVFGFENYQDAIKRKLLRELAPALSDADSEKSDRLFAEKG